VITREIQWECVSVASDSLGKRLVSAGTDTGPGSAADVAADHTIAPSGSRLPAASGSTDGPGIQNRQEVADTLLLW